jgi:SAM-dependent methyltransferase
MGDQRETFNDVADLYDEVRPVAPPQALAALFGRLRLEPGARVIEVGCGTGQTTVELARRGVFVVAVEPGVALAEICAKKTADFDVTFRHERFEDFQPEGAGLSFDAVVASQSAHWISCETFLEKTRECLRPGGMLGLLWHVDRSQKTEFYRQTQPLYDRFIPDAHERPPFTIPQHVARYFQELHASPSYRSIEAERWPWHRTFDEESYLRFLRTHSPVRMLDEADREAFLAAHGELIRRLGGQIERRYETVLITAEKGV